MDDLHVKMMMAFMRDKSGSVDSNDPLVSFLYLLMRDYVTPGIVEEIMVKGRCESKETSEYTNGWLAEYAKYLAERLTK